MRRQNESGYMLVGTILAIVLVMVVGLSLTTLATNSLQTSSTERDNQAVYYIAEAGLTQLAYQFENEVIEIYEDDQVKTEADFFNKIEQFDYFEERYDTFEQVNNVTPYSVRSIEKLEDQYKLTSTGFIGDESRTVSQMVEVHWKEKYEESGPVEMPPYLVFSSGEIIFIDGTIEGNIATLSTQPGAISLPAGGQVIKGTIYVPFGDEEIVYDQIANKVKDIEAIDPIYQQIELPPFPEIPNADCPNDKRIHGWFDVIKNCKLQTNNGINYTLEMNENLKFNEIKVDSNTTLTIDVKDTDREIVVDHLHLATGHIELKGTGNLTIYVTDKMTFGWSSMNQNGDINRLNIFLKGTGDSNNPKTVKLTNNQTINGSFYAEDADIHFAGGTGFKGNIFTGGKQIDISGGTNVASQLILAPNGTLTFAGGAQFIGQVVTKTIHISNGVRLTYDIPFILTGPISIEALQQAQNGSGGSGDSDEIETGNKPTFLHSKVREVD